MANPNPQWPWAASQNDVYEEMQRLRAAHERKAREMMRQAQLGLAQVSSNTAGSAELKSGGSSAATARVQSSPVPNPVLILCPLS